MFFLCVYLFLSSVYTYEVTTKPNSSEKTDIHNLPINVTRVLDNGTKVGGNDTITTQRITQPLQIQKVERILETHTPLNASLRLENENGSLTNFKPSPQLETYYEFNKFPVIPALPEAKTFGGFNNPGYSVNSWDEKPTATVPWSNYQSFQNSWYENPRRQNSWGEINVKPNPNPTTGQPWVSRVKFPSSAANEDPYKFVSNDNKLNSYLPPVSFPTTTESFSFNKPVETPNRNIGKPSPGFWQKLMGNSVNKNAVAIQKTFLDYNIMEKPPQYGTPDKEYETGISPHGSPNPWKKIIKLLTAIIPIGLFISALTPTVISVTSLNDTQSRYRVDDPKYQEIANRVASSLKYADQLKNCEDKILCELLVTASNSKNSEEHIKNLLDTFSENEDLQNKKEDLLKVFEAVRKEDCRLIVCKTLKNPS